MRKRWELKSTSGFSFSVCDPVVMMLLIVLFPVASSFLYLAGASGESCTPSSQDHASSSPFGLDLTAFDRSYGGTLYYIGGRSYTLALSGSGGEQFRGFLVQARAVADGSPVGTFIDNGGHQVFSSCTPSESAVTESSQELQSIVSLNWTAPSQDTGPLYLLSAVAGESVGSSIFWATAATDTLHPCDPPLYLHQEHCIEQCPVLHYGDSASGQCLACPSDYDLMFNATQYFAHLNSETPINSVAFYMQLSINLNSVSLPDVTSLNFRLSQSQLVQNLFEFQGGTSENQIEAVDHIQMIDSDTARVDAAIILVAFPPDTYYPIDIHMNIRALLVSSTGGSVSETSQAIGSIVRAPGACNFVTCQNGGTCEDTDSTHFTCQCVQGYTGETCGELIDLCQILQPCINGICTSIGGLSYNCDCYPGYTGHTCSEHVCEDVECNNGICVSYGWSVSCICDAWYTGTYCETELSNYRECNETGNSTKTNASLGIFDCECLPGWTGGLCETKLLNCTLDNCDSGGKADGEGDWSCPPGWTGTYCETRINICDENPCLNNATCVDGCQTDDGCPSGAYKCQCPLGFTGDTCQEDDPAITFCQPSSCDNSGTCIEGYGPQISCTCTKEFTGTKCTELVDPCSSTPSVLSENIILAIVCAVTVVIIMGMIGCPTTLVLIFRYRAKARVETERPSNNLRRRLVSETSSVFSNNDVDNAIYFQVGPPTSAVASDQSTSPLFPPSREPSGSFSSGAGSPPHLPQSRHTSTSSQFWTEDTLGRGCSFMSHSTSVSDYEQPVQSILLSSHDRPSAGRKNRPPRETVC